MADSILDTVNAAYESLEEPAAPPAPQTEAPAEQPVVETDEQKAERARDEAGRFAKQPKETKEPKRETLKLTPKAGSKAPPAPEASSPGAAPSPTSPAAQPVAPLELETDKDGKILPKLTAPPEWMGLPKIKFEQMPRAVREEIIRHEAVRKAATEDLLPVKELLDVNKEFLVNQAGSVPAAFTQLMQFARMSVDNPVQLAEHILRARGIDPRQAFAGQPQAPQQAQPADLQSLVAQLVEQRLQPFQAQAEQQQTQQLQSTIDQFGADPKHPFFNDVRVHMGQLISAGAAKSMDEAYEQATWANPAIRAHLLETQREATEKANAAQVQKAQQARRASVNGSPLEGATPPNGRSKGSIRDTVRDNWDELASG